MKNFQSYFSTKMKKNYTTKNYRKFLPPRVGFDLGFEKIIFADYKGKNKKAPRAKISVIGTIFTPKIAKKA